MMGECSSSVLGTISCPVCGRTGPLMKTVIIAEKGSQARDIRAAIGSRHGQILPAEGHLLRLAEPEEVDPAWQRWSFALLKPDGLYPTKPDRSGNKAAKLKAIQQA